MKRELKRQEHEEIVRAIAAGDSRGTARPCPEHRNDNIRPRRGSTFSSYVAYRWNDQWRTHMGTTAASSPCHSDQRVTYIDVPYIVVFYVCWKRLIVVQDNTDVCFVGSHLDS